MKQGKNKSQTHTKNRYGKVQGKQAIRHGRWWWWFMWTDGKIVRWTNGAKITDVQVELDTKPNSINYSQLVVYLTVGHVSWDSFDIMDLLAHFIRFLVF